MLESLEGYGLVTRVRLIPMTSMQLKSRPRVSRS